MHSLAAKTFELSMITWPYLISKFTIHDIYIHEEDYGKSSISDEIM